MTKEEIRKIKEDLVARQRLNWELAELVGEANSEAGESCRQLCMDNFEKSCKRQIISMAETASDIGVWALVAFVSAQVHALSDIVGSIGDEKIYKSCKDMIDAMVVGLDEKQKAAGELQTACEELSKAGLAYGSEEWKEGMKAAVERIFGPQEA